MKYYCRSAMLAALATVSFSAGAEIVGCKVVTPPAIINEPGIYCLDRSHEIRIYTGAAIQINSNNVVLDFNGHTIYNSAIGNEAYGVQAYAKSPSLGLRSVTVRNGRLVHFRQVGVNLTGSIGAEAYLVENMTTEYSGHYGIAVSGKGSVVRGNRVVSTGVQYGDASLAQTVRGIHIAGEGAAAIDNVVSQVKGAPGIGIEASGGPVVIARNRVRDMSAFAGYEEIGIRASNDAIIRDNVVVDGKLTDGAVGYGIWASNSSVRVVGNSVSVPGTAYVGDAFYNPR